MYIENKQIKNYISYWLACMFWLICLMIFVGGLTRLTDSGLSITEWQLFSGIMPPLNQSEWLLYFDLYKQIPEYKLQNFSMSLNEFKVIFWWEWAHRILGRIIGLVYLVPLLIFSFKIGIKELANLYLIFLLICFQGFIGWYMVSSGLIDRVDVSHFRLSIHLLLAFILISLIYWNYLKLNNKIYNEKRLNSFLPIFFVLLIFCQISLGAFVSGMDAGKIYNSWPLMGSGYYPDDNTLNNLFKLSAFNDPSLVQFMHRNLAYLILIIYFFIVYKIYRNALFEQYKLIKVLGLLLILQIIFGILTLLYGAQIYIASAHQVSSIFLVSSSIYFLFKNTKFNLQPSD